MRSEDKLQPVNITSGGSRENRNARVGHGINPSVTLNSCNGTSVIRDIPFSISGVDMAEESNVSDQKFISPKCTSLSEESFVEKSPRGSNCVPSLHMVLLDQQRKTGMACNEDCNSVRMLLKYHLEEKDLKSFWQVKSVKEILDYYVVAKQRACTVVRCDMMCRMKRKPDCATTEDMVKHCNEVLFPNWDKDKEATDMAAISIMEQENYANWSADDKENRIPKWKKGLPKCEVSCEAYLQSRAPHSSPMSTLVLTMALKALLVLFTKP